MAEYMGNIPEPKVGVSSPLYHIFITSAIYAIYVEARSAHLYSSTIDHHTYMLEASYTLNS